MLIFKSEIIIILVLMLMENAYFVKLISNSKLNNSPTLKHFHLPLNFF